MIKLRTGAYLAIAAGCLAIGIAAIGIISNSSNATPTIQVQSVPSPQMSADVPMSAAISRPVDAEHTPPAEVAAGFTAYQDENGNFVAPPPGTVLPQELQRAPVAFRERPTTVPGGGVGIDTSGYRMSLTAVTNEDGTVSVTCDPDQSLGHDIAHDHEEQD